MKAPKLVAALAGALVGGVALFVIGAFFGGNLATDFTFAGLRGYEATGIVGLLLGVVGGGVLGAQLVRKRGT
jgi:hypothetical protein